MTTTVATPTTDTALAAATADLQRIDAALATAQAELARINRATRPDFGLGPRAAAPSQVEALRAQAARPAVENKVLLLEAERNDALTAIGAAREVEREHQRAELLALLRPKVAKLHRALVAASAANADVAQVDEVLLMLGGHEPAALFELLPESPECPSRLATWVRAMRAAGLLAD